ncbi:hypothetical protein HOT36_gp39 [Ralstonia phage RPSC1]|uniref:Uncharacterized protein n=1 Tax=Ralstonia phage RPSC1 TaxID=2041351 RepID=A0A2Z2U7Y4_9CAUD|nr:hypothetical protein HOT36_gp39 [Ralstonia phage RPSC1]ATN92969.1 hypothetical protein RPSC1_38 [Ralstonia phage RPSC1]
MASHLEYKRGAFPSGGTGWVLPELLQDAWRDSTLLQRAWKNWIAFGIAQEDYLATQPNVQFAVFGEWHPDTERKILMGGICLAPSWDPQVGDCLVAIHNFITPAARGSSMVQRKLIRLALAEAADMGLRWLLISRTRPDGLQFTTYKEVKQHG